ncbi:DNA polymerase III subunit chi [Sphingomonas oligoaromativorans]|jgi:DNA polymerase-3 subunit chi|uniref:DNA polymerase III subunit chi n=1 Tax=Sphingomonas oligoaromativorans TaxID=575322 RepID=UPI00142498F2|nr:DNA polymerase III subunit chi [Sphingomonas oligoaromativorans]NIJ32381.1 DNA polymerase-3 subunit chi [Sphingomonas oligoaromativorans]
MQVDFYHLGRDPLDRVLASIATRVLAGGGRLLVVTQDDGQADGIDRALWETQPDGFLPHGREGADQPLLIAADCVPVNAARHVALIDGIWRDEALGFERAFHFFDDSSIEAARGAWRGLKGRDGVEPRYWKQDEDGRWGQVA